VWLITICGIIKTLSLFDDVNLSCFPFFWRWWYLVFIEWRKMMCLVLFLSWSVHYFLSSWNSQIPPYVVLTLRFERFLKELLRELSLKPLLTLHFVIRFLLRLNDLKKTHGWVKRQETICSLNLKSPLKNRDFNVPIQ